MFTITTLLFIVLNVILAERDAKKIAHNQFIDHRFNALLYTACIGLTLPLSYFVGALSIHLYAFLIPALLLIRKITFDTALNLYRGKNWWWISLTTTSKIDQFENRMFGYNGKIKYIGYTILLISIIALFFIT